MQAIVRQHPRVPTPGLESLSHHGNGAQLALHGGVRRRRSTWIAYGRMLGRSADRLRRPVVPPAGARGKGPVGASLPSTSRPRLPELVCMEDVAAHRVGRLAGEEQDGRSEYFRVGGLPLDMPGWRLASAWSVSTTPGLRALTAIPYSRSSSAMNCVRRLRPALLTT